MGKVKILEKAWKLNPECLYEPYFCNDNNYYGETAGKVKSKALPDFDSCRAADGEDLTFLNIKVMRDKEFDMVEYDGEKVTRHIMEYRIDRKKRDADLDHLLKDSTAKYAFIKQGAYGKYWGWDFSGYTDKVSAGIYTLEAAVSVVKGGDLGRQESVEPIYDIKEHDDRIKDRIKILEKELKRFKKDLKRGLINSNDFKVSKSKSNR